jgi:hypothetical protein
MEKKQESHRAQAGDVVEITGHRVGNAPRMGEILEVLGEPEEQHFRVRWEDGHESLFYPSSDAVVRPARARSERRS